MRRELLGIKDTWDLGREKDLKKKVERWERRYVDNGQPQTPIQGVDVELKDPGTKPENRHCSEGRGGGGGGGGGRLGEQAQEGSSGSFWPGHMSGRILLSPCLISLDRPSLVLWEVRIMLPALKLST